MNNPAPITIEHNGTTITYDEARNLFCFTLRGRDRTADSLKKAKEFIDKPVKEKKSTTFQRFMAWWSEGYGRMRQVEVTNIAESPSWSSRQQVWISFVREKDECWNAGKTERQKANSENIYPCSEKNDAIAAQITENNAQREALEKSRAELFKKMKPYVIPKDDLAEEES